MICGREYVLFIKVQFILWYCSLCIVLRQTITLINKTNSASNYHPLVHFHLLSSAWFRQTNYYKFCCLILHSIFYLLSMLGNCNAPVSAWPQLHEMIWDWNIFEAVTLFHLSCRTLLCLVETRWSSTSSFLSVVAEETCVTSVDTTPHSHCCRKVRFDYTEWSDTHSNCYFCGVQRSFFNNTQIMFAPITHILIINVARQIKVRCIGKQNVVHRQLFLFDCLQHESIKFQSGHMTGRLKLLHLCKDDNLSPREVCDVLKVK